MLKYVGAIGSTNNLDLISAGGTACKGLVRLSWMAWPLVIDLFWRTLEDAYFPPKLQKFIVY